ncbi:MAG: hypothetical protein KF886_02665 [Candidatus Hydrogenedentes bacterium]|nr:hypothetical protein [Candidatus Hydrogenedentota bacterium]
MTDTAGNAAGGGSPSGDRDHGSAANTCSGPAGNTSLVVQVERSDGQQLSKPADVRIDGPTFRNEKTIEGTDRITFKPINAGQYKVSVNPHGDEEDFDALPPHPQEVVVPQGEEKLATLKIAPPLRAYLHFTFTDPEGAQRNLPKDFKIDLVYNDGSRVSAALNEDGMGVWEGKIGIPVDRRKTDFTVHFTPNAGQFIVCEKSGDPATVEIGGRSRLADSKRGFMLPPIKWMLSNSDWEVTNASNYAENKFAQLDDPNTEIGTEASPVELKLNPHWQFHQFLFFDRKFGPSDHQARISIPPVLLEGFRKAPGNGDARADTAGNWTTGEDPKDLKQAIPWILRKEEDGVTPLPELNQDMELRFATGSDSGNYIFSKSATERELVSLAGNADELQPGPARLAYYDLPRLWRSKAYYTRQSGGDQGKFFYDLTESDISAADSASSPLIFCLDDIVLYQADGSALAPLDPLGDTDKVAIFHHTFSDSGADCSAQGVYKPLAPASVPEPAELPGSDVDTAENYLTDYPDWTRLVIAQGNLFDVFDARTPDNREEKQAVGARAAVRWLDAMASLSPAGIRMWDMTVEGQDADGKPVYKDAADPLGRPLPNRAFCTESSFTERRPGPTEQAFFAMQHFWSQRTAERYTAPYNGSDEEHVGRFDIALLRCCGLEDDKEVAVNLHYLKSSYTFEATPSGSPQQYAHDASVNVSNRWNGNDGHVTGGRARFLPRKQESDEDASEPLVVEAVWFCQAVIEQRAHIAVKVVAVDRAWRNGRLGTGESGPDGHAPDAQEGYPNAFTTAHECGHVAALPDEYNEQWDAASCDQPSLKSNLPGDPFYLEGGALMHRLETPRNRYYWHAAEWVRRRLKDPVHFKVSFTDPGGTTYDKFYLPEHPESGRTFAYWPLASDHKPATPQPVYPSNSRGGLRDLYLYALGRDHYSEFVLPGAGGEAFDGILLIVLKLAFHFPDDVSFDERSDALSAAVEAASALNKKWYASGQAPVPGSSPAADRTFERCLIHFAPRVVVENYVHPDLSAEAALALAGETIDNLRVHYRVQVYPHSPAHTRWDTNTTGGELETSVELLEDIPQGEREKDYIQSLVEKLDEYHGIPEFHLTDRIGKVGEIRLKAEGILESAPDVTSRWDEDTRVPNSRAPLGKSAIEQAIQLYRSTGYTDYDGRLQRLAALDGLLDAFRETADVRGGWKAPTKAKEIDIALSTYENTPMDDFAARFAALDKLEEACDEFIVSTRRKNWLLNMGLYGMIPKVEALDSRARAEKGDVAVMRGVTNMKPLLQAKMDELRVLKGIQKLKAQAREVEADLKAQESSTTLLVEYPDPGQRTAHVGGALESYLPSLAGIHKLPADITREDLIPLVRQVLPRETDVQPLA